MTQQVIYKDRVELALLYVDNIGTWSQRSAVVACLFPTVAVDVFVVMCLAVSAVRRQLNLIHDISNCGLVLQVFTQKS